MCIRDRCIRFFVDGNKFYEMSIANNVGDTEEFHRPFYLLLNVAVGGNWPGFSINDSAFPQEMKVDYVRVYQDLSLIHILVVARKFQRRQIIKQRKKGL